MSEEKNILTYKGHPLMRKDNIIYYGSMADSHIVMLQILDTKNVVRTSKIAELKYHCNKAITNGVNIKLSDGETRHFSMSLEDQINLLTMAYLADESIYSSEDMKTIIAETNAFKNSHIAKFKQLENRVNSLNTIQEISTVNYHEEV